MARYKKPSNYGLWQEIVCGENKGLLGEKNLTTIYKKNLQTLIKDMGRNKGWQREMKNLQSKVYRERNNTFKLWFMETK